MTNLLTLYRLFQGPIATTLENKREPFLPVDPVVPGKNMYPWGVKKEELEIFLAAHPEKRDEIMGSRTPEASAGYVMARRLLIEGPLHLAALRRSVDHIVRRHAVLRTTFTERDGQYWGPPADDDQVNQVAGSTGRAAEG